MFIHRTIYNISLFSYHRQFVTSTWWRRRTATASTRDAGVVGYYCQCPSRSRSWFSSSPARSLSCIKYGILLLVLLDHLRCDINITLYWAYFPNLLSTSFWSPLEFEQSYINFTSTVGVAEKIVVAVRRFPCEHSFIHSFSFSFSSSYNFIENKSPRVENRFS